MEKHETIFVALSGGVDSAVAALLLLKQGFTVRGVFMENWKKSALTPQCTTEEDRQMALRVATHLGIPFTVLNFEKEYEERVVQYFYQEYAAGRTPNPDVKCNKEIKFKALLDAILKLGGTKIATGHYARVEERDGTFHMLKGIDPNKDQTYFLHTLGQKELSQAVFPVGHLTKPELRKKARIAGLPNADRPDSQGICFVGQVNIPELLAQRIPQTPGSIVTADGVHVGQHKGLAFYTIGQRQGIAIGGSGVPYYVAKKEVATNTLVVAVGNQDVALQSSILRASQPTWVAGSMSGFPLQCQAMIRYRQKAQDAIVLQAAGGLMVRFLQPQRAMTPGQSIVFYNGDECLGGAVIEEAL